MARRDKAGPGPRVRPEQAAPQGAPGPEAGAGTKEQAGGTSGQSVPKSKFRQKSRQEQAAASKLRMEKRGEKLEAAKGKLAKQKPQKARPRQTGGRGPGGLRPRLCAWEDLRGGAGKCRHRGGPSLRAFGRVRVPPGLPLRGAAHTGAPGAGRPEGRGPVWQGCGGLSILHRRPGTPGALEKCPVPLLAETAAPQAVPKAGKGGRPPGGRGR